MKFLAAAWEQIYGLLVEDGQIAIGTLAAFIACGAISTLAGVLLVRNADRMPLLLELLPFLKGMTLLFWATATWWIPLLLALGVWRHLVKRVPLTYDHSFWAVVFPLGMSAATVAGPFYEHSVGAAKLRLCRPHIGITQHHRLLD